MKHLSIVATGAVLALFAFLVPASAGNLFASGAVGIQSNDILEPGDWGDSASGAFQLGWDFGTPAVALEYNVNQSGYRSNAAGHDTVFLVGRLDFGKGAFQPGIFGGLGISVDGLDFVDDHHLQVGAGAKYYVVETLALEARYRWISDIDDISDGAGQILAGVHVDF